ncbi:MAG: hypothetical protein QXF14_00145 [Candidatus Woesearchaeota archaeon]
MNKQGAEDNNTLTMNYGLLKDIERIADHYSSIAQTRMPKEAQGFLTQARAQLRMVYELFYSYDHAKAGKLLKELKQLDSSAEKLLRGKSPLAVHHIAGIIQMLNEMSWAVCARSM